jgi:hypothetical protein
MLNTKEKFNCTKISSKFSIIISFFIITLCQIIAGVSSRAQSQGPFAASSASGTTLSGSTSIVSNASNAMSSDNSYASNSSNLASSGNYSDLLIVGGFGFSVPNGSTINGIEVFIERSDVNNKIKDNVVSLIKGGTIENTNKASAVGWPSTDATATYGSNTDLWGTTWTYSDINNSSFGVAFSWKRSGGGSSTAYARVDAVTVTVHYTAPLPIVLTNFTAVPVQDKVQLSWTTSSEIDNDYFVVERTKNLESLITIASVNGGGNSTIQQNYFVEDLNPLQGYSYYRLKQVDFNGQSSFSEWLKVDFISNQHLKIIPNPVNGNTLNIFLPLISSRSYAVTISEITGKIIFEEKRRKEIPAAVLSIENIPFKSSGLYFLLIDIDGNIFSEKFQVEIP